MILFDPDLDPEPNPDAKSAALPSARTLANFLGKAQAALRLEGEVTVLLTTGEAMRKLNRRFRGKNASTDVLSFPAENLLQGQEKIAGDLAIGVPTALRQAMQQGHFLTTELKVLILHGLLHLAGYDHETDAGRMARRERLLRTRLGLPLGLIERVRTKQTVASASRKAGPAARGATAP